MFNKALSIVGALVCLFSLFFVFAAIGDLMDPNEVETEKGVLVGLLVFFSASAVGGGYRKRVRKVC